MNVEIKYEHWYYPIQDDAGYWWHEYDDETGACYCKDQDIIFMGDDKEDDVLCHELIHATGANHRLVRQLNVHANQSEDEFVEEMIAELGCAMLLDALGLKVAYKKHKYYVNKYCKLYKKYNRKKVAKSLINEARIEAIKAVEYLTGKTPNVAVMNKVIRSIKRATIK